MSVNVQERLPLHLRMLDPEELSKYNCMTPTAMDYLANYTDAIERMDFQIDTPNDGGYTLGAYVPGDAETEATGTRPYGTRPVTYHSWANNILAYDMNRPAGTAYYHKSRGSWLMKQMYAIDAGGTKVVPRIDDREVYVKFDVTEPLWLRSRKTRLLW